MYPILWQSGEVIVPAWHVFYGLAALAAYAMLLHWRQRFYPDVGLRSLAWVYLWGYGGGYLGARFLSILIDQPEVRGFVPVMVELLRLGPMTFYGGLLGAAFAVIIYSRISKLNLAVLVDLGMPAGLTALSIGRLGCFLNGDDYGIVAGVGKNGLPPWWAVKFPYHAEPVYRVPVQLIESAGAAMIVGLVYVLAQRRRPQPPFLGLLCLLLYGLLRFCIEFLRGDPRGWVIEGVLTPSQFISLLLMGLSVCLLWQRQRVADASPR